MGHPLPTLMMGSCQFHTKSMLHMGSKYHMWTQLEYEESLGVNKQSGVIRL